MRKPLFLFAVLMMLPLGAVAYTKLAARLAPGTPPAMAPLDQQADRIVVSKAARSLTLMRGDVALKSYRVSMGADWDGGHKQREGDERTPEGAYVIDWRNPNSVAHLSLHISYPNAQDMAHAAERGVSPGGNIMIHGLPNGWGALGGLHRYWDWTDGCLAVTNAEMQEIWSLVPDGTPITIRAD